MENICLGDILEYLNTFFKNQKYISMIIDEPMKEISSKTHLQSDFKRKYISSTPTKKINF